MEIDEILCNDVMRRKATRVFCQVAWTMRHPTRVSNTDPIIHVRKTGSLSLSEITPSDVLCSLRVCLQGIKDELIQA